MKQIKMRLAMLLGGILLVGTFYIGWEWSYHHAAGSLYSYTRFMLYSIYLLLFVVMMRVYGGFKFGSTRVSHLVYSQSLAEAICIAFAYVVAVANLRAFVSPLPLLLILGVQLLINILFSLAGNRLYYHLHKAKRTVVIYRNKEDLEKLREIQHFSEKFTIVKYLDNPTCIEQILPELADCEVVFVTGVEATLRNGVAKYCVEKGVTGYIYPHIGDVIMMRAEHMQMFSVPLVRIRRASPNPEFVLFKRLFDIVTALCGILLTSVFMLVTAIAIKAYDGGPVLYKQTRLTKDGKHFQILKFRSMRVDAEKDGVARLASDHDDRITPVGKVIRACRFDELPQLFNVLVGDMSIVGPRPERPEIAAQYEKELPAFNLRLQCKAGLTGYAQAYGRYNTEPRDKLKMDLMYIHNMSILEDLKLCFYTVKILFMKESTQGIAEGQITAQAEKADPEEKEKEPASV